MGCCSNNLGRYPHNRVINTGLLIPAIGTYTIQLEAANGNTFELEKEYTIIETIKFEIGELNEDMEYKFKVVKPDDSLLLLNECDTYKLKTIINTQINGCTDTCDDADDNTYYPS